MRTPCWLLALAFALGLGVLTPAADPPKADAEQIAKLVKQLSSDEFESREKATRELEAIGAPALEALRDAAKTGDAEVKTRATSILEKVEKKASAEKVLAPTKVKLAFKDTPVADAVAEFNKKSGYTIQLHDPEKKLKDRTVTLDTGEVTFWEAFDKFCEKAGLVEATWQDVMKPIAVPPRGGPGGGILPPPPPIVVPKDLGIKGDPLAPAKDEPAPKKEEPKKDDGAKDAPPPVAVRRLAQVAPLPPPAGGFAGPALKVAPGFGGMIGMDPAIIMVLDGKPKTVPTCYSGAVRIRALKDAPNLGIPVPVPGAKDDTHQLWLEVRAEPKLQLLNIQSVAVEKAIDDRDQKLDKVTPPAPDAPPGVVPGRLPRRALPAAPAVGYIGGLGGFGGTQYFQVPLKKGEKEAKAIKEFAGTISANLMAPAEAVITAEKITKAAGETFKGKDGGHIKVTEVKEEDGKITIKFELEAPQNAAGGGFGGIGIAIPGGPVQVAPPPPPAPIPPAPALPPGGAGFAFEAEEPPAPLAPAAQIQIQIAPAGPPGGGLAAPRPGYFPAQGIALVDDKGKTIAQTAGAPPKFEFVPGGTPKVEYTQEYKLEKDQKPAKLVFSSSKMVTLDIPFSFKDVPLK